MKRAATIVLALIVAGLAALAFWEFFLAIDNAPARADAIIVLGGSPRNRPGHAAELWNRGVAPTVIVSGQGDCQNNKTALKSSGVSEPSILLECESRSTLENARLTARLLGEQKAATAIIVTDPFHSRRALRTFEEEIPTVRFYSSPAWPKPGEWRHPPARELRLAAVEYVKLFWYAVRHGINPF